MYFSAVDVCTKTAFVLKYINGKNFALNSSVKLDRFGNLSEFVDLCFCIIVSFIHSFHIVYDKLS